MNCQDFEQIIGDLARLRPLDAGARAEADSHGRECARCAARLADERALSAGLKALAATMKDEEAPARVEGALLAAFRARAAEAARDAAPTPAPAAKTEELPAGVLPFVRPQADRQWSWKKTLATAATAAAAAANAAPQVEVSRIDLRSAPGPWAPTVCANLVRPLLLDVAARLERPPGRLIASGLLREEAGEVAAAFAARGLREADRRATGDWCALLLCR